MGLHQAHNSLKLTLTHAESNHPPSGSLTLTRSRDLLIHESSRPVAPLTEFSSDHAHRTQVTLTEITSDHAHRAHDRDHSLRFALTEVFFTAKFFSRIRCLHSGLSASRPWTGFWVQFQTALSTARSNSMCPYTNCKCWTWKQ